MKNWKYDVKKDNFIKLYEKDIEKINEYKKELEKAKNANDTLKMEYYAQQIKDKISQLKYYKTFIEYMRPMNDKDNCERNMIMWELPSRIKWIVPDNIPIVFHGTSNIGTVLEIIKTGGLLTPEQRGEIKTPFTSKIDVTYKTDITVSCEFAEPGIETYMPYGAIFVFTPLPEEVKNVLNTGARPEVLGGVKPVNFVKNPERLIGIITTLENKMRIKTWCNENNWDENKVFTYLEFIEILSNEYIENLKLLVKTF